MRCNHFYVHTADTLDALARRKAITFLVHRLRDLWISNVDANPWQDWSMHSKFVTIDFDDAVADTKDRLDILERAREAVTSDPGSLAGLRF